MLKEILNLIERISPHAKEYVDHGFKNKNCEIYYTIFNKINKGVFLKVENSDCCIFYASFLNESNIEQVLDLIKNKVNEYIPKIKSKEVCFNVYGNNYKIINLVRDLGFEVDMEGYHLEFIGEQLPELKECKLINKTYENRMLHDFVDLFDSSYYELHLNNGWQTNSHSINEEQFRNRLNKLNDLNQVCSFWADNELVGAYIFEHNYITDFVVKPKFQNKGYGSYILAHSIRNMSENKTIENIRLRVAKSNIGAKKLYERNKFTDIACFAEHTYRQVV